MESLYIIFNEYHTVPKQKLLTKKECEINPVPWWTEKCKIKIKERNEYNIELLRA